MRALLATSAPGATRATPRTTITPMTTTKANFSMVPRILTSAAVPGEGRRPYHAGRMIRTKIVATMGPACGDVETLYRLFEAGADVCRLNFSHGKLEQHLLMLRNIREAAARFSHPIAVLGDLGGPKIRLGEVPDVDGSGGLTIQVGDELIIQRENRPAEAGPPRRVSSTYKHLIDDLQIGHRVYIEDGLLRFVCTDK